MKINLRSLAILAGLSAAGPAVAQSDYIFDLAKKDAGLIKAWGAIVPPAYVRQPWIKTLDGTTFPVKRTQIGGKTFYLGAVCKPHDCGGNEVVFLIAADHAQAFGLLSSQNLNVANAPFGKPDAEALETMRKYMASH